MAKKTINIGQTTNDRSGDPLRTAFGKVNDNFTELYNAIGLSAAATLPYYDNTTARDTAIPSPENGMVCIVGGSLYFYGNAQWVELSGTP